MNQQQKRNARRAYHRAMEAFARTKTAGIEACKAFETMTEQQAQRERVSVAINRLHQAHALLTDAAELLGDAVRSAGAEPEQGECREAAE